jgi:hypothetical protein
MSSADPEERRERSAGHCLKRAEVHVCRRMDIALIVHLGPMARLAAMNEIARGETPRGFLSASPRAHSQREREGGVAEEAAIAAPRLGLPVQRRSSFRGPRSWYPALPDAIAENGLHQMSCIRCLAVDKARRTCFEGTTDRELYSFRRRSPVPRVRSA